MKNLTIRSGKTQPFLSLVRQKSRVFQVRYFLRPCLVDVQRRLGGALEVVLPGEMNDLLGGGRFNLGGLGGKRKL